MAGEISINFKLDCINGDYRPGAINVSGLSIDQAAAGEAGGVLTATTSDNITLGLGGLVDPGILYMRNISASTTNIVSWGFTTDGLVGQMKSGEIALTRTSSGASVHLKHTYGAGGCKVHYRWLED